MVSCLAGSELVDLSTAHDYAAPEHCAAIADKRLPESSGLVQSRLREDLLWTVNDSGNKPHVLAINHGGQVCHSFAVAGIANLDWEDLSAFTLGDQHYLLIPDVGDNAAVRPFCQITVVREPQLKEGEHATLPIAWSFVFQYADSARDCESVAVDEEEELIYLISKRDVPPRIYTLPLKPDEQKMQVARFVGTVPHIPQPIANDLQEDKQHGRERSQITAMDFDHQRGRAVLNTYKHAYLFERDAGSWAEAFEKQPLLIERTALRQSETICFDRHGNIYYGSEQLPWPLMKINLKAVAEPAVDK
jgi:hypothetical protein